MFTASRSWLTALILISVFIAIPAMAHDLWLERQDAQFVLQYGHHGGELLPLSAEKVKSLRCRAHKGAPQELRPRAKFSTRAAQVKAECAAISAAMDNGFFCLTPDGEKNLPKSRCPQAVKSWHSRQFAKWVDPQADEASKLPLGDELEIVPLTDLSKVKTGDKASFRVLLAGKPLSGAVAAINHQPLGETDSQGQVRLRLRAKKLESISVTMRRKIDSAEADQQIFEASLSFPVSK